MVDPRIISDALILAGFAFMFTNLSGMFGIFAKVQAVFKDRGIDACAFCLAFWMWLVLPIVRYRLGIGYAGVEYFEVFMPTIGASYLIVAFLIYAKAQAMSAEPQVYYELASYEETEEEITLD